MEGVMLLVFYTGAQSSILGGHVPMLCGGSLSRSEERGHPLSRRCALTRRRVFCSVDDLERRRSQPGNQSIIRVALSGIFK